MKTGEDSIRKMKLEAVAALLDGTMTESDAARKFDVSVYEIAEWKAMFAAGMRYSLQSETTPRHRVSSPGRMRVAVAVSLVLLLVVGGATAASVQGAFDCDPMDPSFFCFQPNSPARASEINSNFIQMSEWIEGAVGPVDAPALVSSTGGDTAYVSVSGVVHADDAQFGSANIGTELSSILSGELAAETLTVTGSAGIANQMTVGADFTANREDTDSENDYDLSVDGDLNVDGDVRISGTLQLDGQIEGLLTVSDEYAVNYPGVLDVTMTEKSRSFCYLTTQGVAVGLAVPDTIILNDIAVCEISASSGSWHLSISTSGYGIGSSCSARCISW